MNTIKKTFFACLLFVVSSVVFADSASDQLIKLLNQIHTMQSNFEQKMVDKNGKTFQKSNGVMALQRPGKFRWEIKKPNAQLIIADNKKLWIYDPDLSQVTIRPLSNDSGEAPALLLSDTQQALEKKFTISVATNNTTTMRWFVLIPHDPNSVFTSIRVGFLNNLLHAMQMHDHLDQTTNIQFEWVQPNPALPASLFSFKPPKGVDVIDETNKQQ